jgi:hypothetical protein
VKGWIVENKGHLVNWVEVAIATVWEKAWQVTLGLLSRGPSDNLDYSDGFS